MHEIYFADTFKSFQHLQETTRKIIYPKFSSRGDLTKHLNIVV